MEFIETDIFTKQIQSLLADEEYRQLQKALVQNPKLGVVIPRTGGLRKLRWAVSGRGRRGGLRLIYYFYLSANRIYMLYPYKKSDQEDLTKDQMKKLSQYVQGGVL